LSRAFARCLFVAYFTTTHWVPMPPFNDLRHENKPVIAAMQVVLGVLAVATLLGYRWAVWSAVIAYTLVLAALITSWVAAAGA
jgi:hypothetical protein